MGVLPRLSSNDFSTFIDKNDRLVRGLQVRLHEGKVEITGEVGSFYHKQLVLRDALHQWGASRIRFRISVLKADTISAADE